MKRLAALLLIAAMLLCGCSGGGEKVGEEEEISERNTLYLTGYNFSSENPLDVKNTVNRDIFSLCYQGLYKTNEKGESVPVLAVSDEESSDGLTHRITLRNDMSFHNGNPFSATDVVYTINYIKNNPGRYSDNVANISTAYVVSADVVSIRLKEPSVNFTALLTFPVISSGGFGETGFNGTGTFKVSSYVRMKKIIMKRAYGEGDIKRIEVQLVPDGETARFASESGMADVYLADTLTEANTDLSKGKVKTVDFINNVFGFLLLNPSSDVFKEKAVRKAIDLSIDRKEIVENILFGKAVEAYTPVRPGYFMQSGSAVGEINIEEAKNILSENGFEWNVSTGVYEKTITVPAESPEAEEPSEEELPPVEKKLSLSFSILVNVENSFRIQIAEAIARTLKLAGIQAGVKALSFEEYEKAIAEGSYDAVLCSMALPENNDLSCFAAPGGICNTGSLEGKSLITAISVSETYEERKEAWFRLEGYFRESLPVISLYFEKSSLRYSGKITDGLNPTPFNTFNNAESWELE